MSALDVDILDVEECAKSWLDPGMDGAYISTLDELHDFAICLKRKWERKQKEENEDDEGR